MNKRICSSLIVLALTCFFVIPLFAQSENKVAVITVSGSGKTQDEAKQNALRNAIEQAFGTFISSNTQILNDELVKDEIVSVSNGNIQEYSVISEVQTLDGNWSNTVKATVSINKLTSFCESKGVTIEFKGSLFAINIKQQELNLKNEEKAIENMCKVLKEISENCFDYEISAGQPVTSFLGIRTEKVYVRENAWDIPITIYAIPNNNLKTISDYFVETLKGLSLSSSEIDNYKQLGKNIYYVHIKTSTNSTNTQNPKNKKNKNQPILDEKQELLIDFGLRSRKSLANIYDFLGYFRKSLLNFKIVNDLDEKIGHSFFFEWNESINCDLRVEETGFKPSVGHIGDGVDYGPSILTGYPFTKSRGDLYPYLKDDNPNSIDTFGGGSNFFEYVVILFNDLPIGKKCIQLTYNDTRSTEDASKITGYNIMFCKNSLDIYWGLENGKDKKIYKAYSY